MANLLLLNKTILIILILSIVFFNISCSKNEDFLLEEIGSSRYETEVFTDVKITENINYGQNLNQDNEMFQLYMDVYEPEYDSESQRPLVVLAHGGSFIQGDKFEFNDLAVFFAKSGYIATTINYRLINSSNPDSDQIKRAVMDAVFDMKAAIRYFVKDANEQNVFRIDTTNIFVGGYSAGAFTALHLAYMKGMKELGKFGGESLVQYVKTNGGLEGNSGNPGYSARLKAVINISGALYHTVNIHNNDPALFSIHGTNDAIVPFLEGPSLGIDIKGSGLLHQITDKIGVQNYLIAYDEGGHYCYYNCSSCKTEIRQFVCQNL